eukprot:snap_masked-scaffold_11-processed-gene-12.21-mRNA-1 protein AED:1.00 eAED:1.00 QI:0/0/0/0/1/1/2/0/67
MKVNRKEVSWAAPIRRLQAVARDQCRKIILQSLTKAIKENFPVDKTIVETIRKNKKASISTKFNQKI